MKELIKITEMNGRQAVSARELYTFLEVKSIFTHWCNRMFSYGFEEGSDFLPFLAKSTGGRPATDYALTLDTAKEISMLQRTEKGKQARQYFIECEKKLRQITMSRFDLMRTVIDTMEENSNRLSKVEQRQTVIEAKVTDINTDYYSLAGYYQLRGRRFDFKGGEASAMGKRLSKSSRLNGYEIGKTYSARHGYVNTYHLDVLKATLNF